MNDENIRYLGDVQKLALAPDDIIVLKVAQPLSHENAERLQKMAERQLGLPNKVIVLTCGIEIGVLSPEKVAA